MATTEVRSPKPATTPDKRKEWLIFAAILCGALAVLFYQSFVPGQVLFANDGSLGAMKAESNRLPGRFTGTWQCLSWLGIEAPAAAPGITAILGTLIPPEFYLKIYAPFTLFFLGFCAWVLFRQLNFDPMVCVLGGVAMGLNMHFFSIACWGLGTWNMSAGMILLAFAALSSKAIRQTWAKALLAGLAVGLNLMEGFDSGAILSLYLGAFIVFRAFNQSSTLREKVTTSVISVPLVVLFAAFIAADTMSSLFETQVQDVARTSDKTPLLKRWDFATQWSLPKMETLRILIPGLFGYRMDQFIEGADKTSAYWGTSGEDPRLLELRGNDPMLKTNALIGITLTDAERDGMSSDNLHARTEAILSLKDRYQMRSRHSGNGEYASVLIAILAAFALANTWRGGNTPYTPYERRAVWFWGLAALFSLLAAWGRHGFVYQALWRLPFFSSIRNPIKFLHPFHLAWVILGVYGLEALYRRYIKNPVRRADFILTQVVNWFSKASGFDKKWAVALLAVLGVSIVGVFVMAQYKGELTAYLQDQGFRERWVPRMINFSMMEAIWYLVFLAVSIWALFCVLSGAWAGPRAKWAWIFLGTVLVLDLGRSDNPWISYFDYKEKYSANPVTDFLEQKPYEHRVIGRLSPLGLYTVSARNFGLLYHFWLQNDFPYDNIEALDFAQWPRMPTTDSNYLGNFICKGTDLMNADLHPATRLFQLTNTRFLIANAQTAEVLNERGDAINKGFQVKMELNMVKKPGVSEVQDLGDLTVDNVDKGPFALIEYTNALPRAKLYSDWTVPADDAATLSTLAASNFNAWQTVLVASNTPPPQASSTPNADPGTVDITVYRPKYIQMQANARTPAVLLLNDRISPDWRMTVDKKPAPILRCNYIMRGAFLTPGNHTVEFRFRPSLKPLYVSLCAWVAGLAVIGFVCYSHRPVKSATKP